MQSMDGFAITSPGSEFETLGQPLIRLDRQQLDTVMQNVAGGAANVQDIYPLAPAQEAILFHRLLSTSGDPYVLSTVFELQSQADIEVLALALQRVIDRHDILRTAIIWEHVSRPLQVVHRRVSLQIEEATLSPGEDARAHLEARMQIGRTDFDIRRAPLMKLVIAANADGGWYALMQVHHIACDDQSWRAVIEETMACIEQRERELPEVMPYRDYVAQALAESQADKAAAYFDNKLGSIDEPTAPFGLLDIRADGSEIKEAQSTIDPALATRVRAQARRLGVSAARLFHAVWALVISHTSGRDDVVFGTVLLTAKQRAAGPRMLGISINTLPLRLKLQDLGAEALVLQTHQELRDLKEHQHAPLSVAQQSSAIAGGAPLFSALLNYRRRWPTRTDAQAGGSARIIGQRGARTNYPITLAVDDLGEDFALIMQTVSMLDASRMLGYVETALGSLVEALETAPQRPALDLPIMPSSEWRTVVEELGGRRRPAHADERLIHELFEQQVQATPDATAVVWEDCSLTYRQLNDRANQLAWHLRSRGVGPDRLVGICTERGLEMIVGLLAILKAGGAYVPLDPNYPAERLQYMLEDADPAWVLVQKHLQATLPNTLAEMIAIDSDTLQQHPVTNLPPRAVGLQPAHLAYVMYTSGSTGFPKGVMIEHRNVTRLFAATAHWFNFGSADVWTLFHSYAFDFSVWELWGPLFTGGQVVVVPHLTARSPSDFYQLLCDRGVTVLNQTPSAFGQLAEASERSEHRHSLRVVIFGGEALELRTLQRWVERHGTQQPQLVNMYGITETTVHVTYCPLGAEQIVSERGSLIGIPIPDLRVLLLDRHRRPVPIGVTAEMYVGGAGVARGYWNRPELTAARFISDPFDASKSHRLYKSGDLARWRADGTLQYIGRNDEQVKIRGFRIELGELQAQLARHELVRDAAVIVREGTPGEKRLIAYVVPHGAEDVPDAASLRAHMRAVLPEHMVPSAFVVMERLPLTANGKLDRRALPAPDLDAFVTREYEPPQGDVEQALAGIWGELLHLERVSRDDNFFELGGHSLLAMQLIARVQAILGVEISMRVLFDVPTLRELAESLVRERQAKLSDRIADAGDSIEALLDRLTSMPEGEVQNLLRQLTADRRV
jgi:arthrofactin-type cyclic lipopeptide synthetase B